MTPIEQTKPEVLQLQVRQQFAVSKYESNEEVIHIIRQKAARMLSERIMDEPKFYNLKIDKSYGELRVDVMVMTQVEYMDLCKRQFKAGLEHAQGFMPRDFEIKEST